MLQQQSEVHLIKTTVLLKKVSISVRFPCSISFALKHQHTIIQHKGIHELRKGECLINQPIELQLQIAKRRGSYEEKKVSLLIYMVSANGKIPAGTVTLTPNEKVITDRRAPLEKCPDKNAEATYTQSFQVLEVVQKTGRLNLSSLQLGSQSLGSKIKYCSSSKNLLLEGEHPQESVRTQAREDSESKLYSSKHQRSSKDLRLSQTGKVYERKASRGRFTRFEQLGKKSVATIERESCQLKVSRVSSQFAEAHDEQAQHQSSRIFKIQQDKANYLKKLAKMRDSLVRIDSEQRLQLQEEIQKAKYENEVLQDEMEVLKERTRHQERRERESTSVVKDLKEELDKRKSRIVHLDSSRLKIESELSEKDRLLFNFQNEKKQLQEQIQEHKALLLSSHKRLELKQNSYNEQLRKLNQKYAQSESERQKAVLDYNNILAQIQTSEKRNQLSLRQKEKIAIEEKARLAKRVEQLNNELGLSNQKVLELKISVQEYQQLRQKMAETNSQREYKINRLNEENQLLLNEIRCSEQNYKKAHEEKQRLQELFQEDKVNYKKKYAEAVTQIATLKEKLEKALKNNANAEARILYLQTQTEQQIKEKNGFILKLQQYKKQVNKFLSQEENRQRMAETFSIQNISQNQKLSDFKVKLDAQRKRFEQMENQYEDQVQYLVKSKEMIQSEIQELRWALEKEAQKFQIVSAKNKELNDEIIELSQKNMQFQERENSYYHQNQQKEQLIKELNAQKQNLAQKQKVISSKLKEKEEQCFGLQKKIENFKQSQQSFTQKLQKIYKILQEKTDLLQKAQQQGSNKLKEKEKEISWLSKQVQNSKQMINGQNQQLQMKNSQLQMIKQSYKVINSDYSSLISKSDYAREQLKRKDTKIQQLQFALNQEKLEKQALRRQAQRKAMTFQQYKANTIKSLQQFFSLLNKEQADFRRQSSILMTLPEQKLSLLQIQSLKKRNFLISKSQQDISELTNRISFLQSQEKRQEKYIADMQEHHAGLLKKQQERYKLLSEQNLRQFNEFSEKMQNVCKTEDLRCNQIEHFNTESKRYSALIEELNQVITRLRGDQHQLKNEVVKLENEVFSYKQKEIKDKLTCNTQADELKHILQLEQQRMKQQVESHREQLKSKEKLVMDKLEEIKKGVARQEQLKMELRKKNDKARQLEQRIQSQMLFRENVEKQLRQKEASFKIIQQQRTTFELEIQRLKVRENALQQSSKKSKIQIEFLQQKHQSQRLDLQNRYQVTIESEKREREKRQKIESSRSKLQQENKQTRQKCVKLQSEVEFYKFYKVQSAKKIEQLQRYKGETMAELAKYRETTLKTQKEIGNFENKYYKMQVEMESVIKEKSILAEDNLCLKEKIKEQEERLMDCQSAAGQLESRQKEIAKLSNLIKSNEQQWEKQTMQLKASLAKCKQSVGQKCTKIKQLQTFMQQKYSDLSEQREKWQKQVQCQKNLMQMRILELQDKYQLVQQEYEFQRLQAIREIESSNGSIQELNEVIRDKEEALQHKDDIINEQTVRLQELNSQLHECIGKWQAEKQSYLPTSAKMAEISEELTRMNKFIGELDGRNKQLLQINRRKMQQNVLTNPPITLHLKDLYVLMQKNKNRILARCHTEKDKEIVIGQFRAALDKLDLTLKSTQIVVAKA